MKIPFESTLSEQDAVFSLHVHAEEAMSSCIANFFKGDPDAGAKMLAAQCRREAAQKKWHAFCVEKYPGTIAVD